jgi:hypothetical protein
MIISYIEDKKKKRHALPIGLVVNRRMNNAAVVGKTGHRIAWDEGMVLRRGAWLFFLLRSRLSLGFRTGLLEVGRAGNVHGKTRDPNARR